MSLGPATPLDDTLIGTSDADTIDGLGGDDLVRSLDGDDGLAGGAGNDRLVGDAGDDTLAGGPGDDVLTGVDGSDELRGGADADLLDGDDGQDLLLGDEGNDALYGGRDRDLLVGDAGDDRLVGGDGADDLRGDRGDSFPDAPVAGRDRLRGGHGGDRIAGDAGDDRLWGETGDDELNGGQGNDRLCGGSGSDRFGFFGGVSLHQDAEGHVTETFTPTGVDVILDFKRGVDVLVGGAVVIDPVDNVQETIELTFAALDSNENGVLDDVDAAIDVRTVKIDGVGKLSTVVDLAAAIGMPAESKVALFGVVGLRSGDVGLPRDTFSTYPNSLGNDTLEGGRGDDTLEESGFFVDPVTGEGRFHRGQGDDLVHGRAGRDTLHAGNDDDRVFGDAGADLVAGGLGADTVHGGDGDDVVHGDLDTFFPSNAALDPTGGVLPTDDTLFGDAGDDTLFGGIGDDRLTGGAGRDLLLLKHGYRFDPESGLEEVYENGDDVVLDFRRGVDVLQIQALGDADRLDFAELDTDGSGVLDEADTAVAIRAVTVDGVTRISTVIDLNAATGQDRCPVTTA